MTNEERQAAWINALERRVGDLELLLQRRAPVVAYAPTWTAVSVNPIVGTDGSRRGWYQIIGGRCFFRLNMAFGTAPGGGAGGTGVYSFGVPPGAPIGSTVESFGSVGSGHMIQNGVRYNCAVQRDGTSQGFQLYSPVGPVSSTSPASVNFGDGYLFSGSYEL